MRLWQDGVPGGRQAAWAAGALALQVALVPATGLLACGPGGAALHLPAGVAFALVVGLGPGHAVTIFAAILVSALWLAPGPGGLPADLAAAALVASVYGAAAWLLRERAGFDPRFRRFRDAVWFIAAALAASLAGGLATAAGGPGQPASAAWAARVPGAWVGEVAAILALGPVLLVHLLPWATGAPRDRPTPDARRAERSLQALAVGAGVAVVWTAPDGTRAAASFLLLVPAVWIAVRSGLRASTAAAALLTAGAAAALACRDPSGGAGGGSLLVALPGTALLLAALVEEHARTLGTLRERERHLARAETVARLGSWTWDLETGECRWSSQLFRLHGLVPGSREVGPDTWLEFVDPDERPEVERAVERAVEAHCGFHMEYRIVDAEGSHRRLASWGDVEESGEGRVVRVTGTCRDVTQERLVEEEAFRSRRMEALGRLASGVAHDFNNFLMVVDGRASLLEGVVDDEARGDVGEIRLTTERARDLTGRLLEFARGGSFEPEELDVSAELERHDWILRRLLGDDVRLVLDLEPGLPPVSGERTRLEQVVTNLVVNAREAVGEGGTVRLRAWECEPGRELPDGRRWVAFEVADDGVGMDEETLERVFDPFFTTRRDEGGTGLGLATVHRIVEELGGIIRAESRIGEGAAFRVYLPARSRAAHAGAPTIPPRREAP